MSKKTGAYQPKLQINYPISVKRQRGGYQYSYPGHGLRVQTGIRAGQQEDNRCDSFCPLPE